MKLDFYIIEDDISIIRILENIISEYNLGYVVGNSCNSDQIINDIYNLKPDIALVDFLLPYDDGLQIIRRIKETNFKGKFVMISEVTTKNVISEAYKLGIENYINKPINVIEVVKVIEKIMTNLKNERIINLLGIDMKNEKNILINYTYKMNQIYKDLGIIGQSGIKNLNAILKKIIKEKQNNKYYSYNMYELYQYIVEENIDQGIAINVKTVEQRLRRLAITSIENIASIGIEDFSNYKFEKYSTSLFNYKDVKKEMDYLRGKSKYKGKINIKKFIEGICMFVLNEN